MTDLEKVFCDADDFMNEVKLPHFIHGSTLLGIIRNKRILDREIEAMLPVDKEHNWGCMYEDITPEFISKLKQRYPFVQMVDGYKPHTLIWFGDKPTKDPSTEEENNMWNIPRGFSLLAAFHWGKTYVIEDMANDRAMVWPHKYLDNPRLWGNVEILGRTVKTPRMSGEWLDYYFGKDWMVERKHWHWIQDSHNLKKMSDLIKEGEVI